MSTDKKKLVALIGLVVVAVGIAGFSAQKSTQPGPLPEVPAGPNARTEDEPEIYPGVGNSVPHSPKQEQ